MLLSSASSDAISHLQKCFNIQTLVTGIVNQLLSFRGWIPLSRLTYCAYLLNPFIIQSIHLNKESADHVDLLPLVSKSRSLNLNSSVKLNATISFPDCHVSRKLCDKFLLRLRVVLNGRGSVYIINAKAHPVPWHKEKRRAKR